MRNALLISAVLLFASTSSFAATKAAEPTDKMMSVGVLAGAAVLGNNLGTSYAFGLDSDYKLDSSFGLGFRYTYNGMNVAAPASGYHMLFLAEGNYFFTGDLKGLNAGVKLGIGIASASVTVASISVTSSTTNFAVGAGVGYDWSVGTDLTLGLDVTDVIIMTSGSSTNDFQPSAVFKYWW